MACIFLVEDNTLIREAVSGYLKLENHEIVEFPTAEGVEESVEKIKPDLLILDVMLPDGNGFLLAKSIRSFSSVPLIFLTAKDSESDRILGFELGADDYICKPFSAKELVLRVQALLKRVSITEKNENNSFKGPSGKWNLNNDVLILDTKKHFIKLNGADIELTGAEWKILVFLAENFGQVISREQILSQCFNYFFEGSERTVDTHMANLRGKLGSGWISTVRGFGYKFMGNYSEGI